jgi:hypothetical protein
MCSCLTKAAVIVREEAILVRFDKVDFSLETQIVIGLREHKTNYDLVYNLVFTCRMLLQDCANNYK